MEETILNTDFDPDLKKNDNYLYIDSSFILIGNTIHCINNTDY